MTRPRLLDLFCCEGGASVGYARAGFEVVGVDIAPQPGYPFEFHQEDALEYLAEHFSEFDAIAASPPCQAYSITRNTHGRQHPDLLAPTREALQATGRPYIIENVPGAPLVDPVTLCGSEFGLRARDTDGTEVALRRHRLFESNVWLMGAGGCRHDATPIGGVYGGAWNRKPEDRDRPRKGGYVPAVPVRAALLGIDWPVSEHGLSQAIPPAYTAFLGAQLLASLE